MESSLIASNPTTFTRVIEMVAAVVSYQIEYVCFFDVSLYVYSKMTIYSHGGGNWGRWFAKYQYIYCTNWNKKSQQISLHLIYFKYSNIPCMIIFNST